jgi:hypothetical protein
MPIPTHPHFLTGFSGSLRDSAWQVPLFATAQKNIFHVVSVVLSSSNRPPSPATHGLLIPSAFEIVTEAS